MYSVGSTLYLVGSSHPLLLNLCCCSAKSGLLILSRQMYSVGFANIALDLLLVRVDEELGAKEEVEDVIELLDDVIEVEEVDLVKGKERMSVEA